MSGLYTAFAISSLNNTNSTQISVKASQAIISGTDSLSVSYIKKI